MLTHRHFIAAALIAATLPLGACASTSGAVNLINAVEKNLDHCHHTVTYAASVGAMNPGSGAQIQGTIDCPATSDAATAAPAP